MPSVVGVLRMCAVKRARLCGASVRRAQGAHRQNEAPHGLQHSCLHDTEENRQNACVAKWHSTWLTRQLLLELKVNVGEGMDVVNSTAAERFTFPREQFACIPLFVTTEHQSGQQVVRRTLRDWIKTHLGMEVMTHLVGV